MLYLKCPTCGTILGDRIRIYETELEKIETDLTSDEAMKLDLKEKLVNSLELEKYCCKMRLITYKDKTEIFK